MHTNIKSPPPRTRNLDIDSLRVVAALAVVALHVSSHVISDRPSIDSLHWWIGNIFDSFTRWCVPVFVMISGAMLIRPRNGIPNLPDYYKSKMPRVIAPLLFWSAAYFSVRHLNGETFTGSVISKDIFQGKPYYHLWYLYMLFGLYLFAPFVSELASSLDKKSLLTLIGFCMLFSSASLISASSGGTFLGTFVPYVGYFLAGHWVYKYRPKIAAKKLTLAFMAAGLTIAALTGALLPRYGSNAWAVMYSNFSPLVALMSVIIFVGWINPRGNSKISAQVATLAPYSFGVYLIHPLWMHILENLWVERLLNAPHIMLPIVSLSIFSVSLGSIFLLARIPFIQRCI